MKHIFLLVHLVLFSSFSALSGTGGGTTQPPHSHLTLCPHLEYGTPKQSDLVLCREGYAIGYNNKLKSAEWVSYTLDKELGNDVERQDNFRVDPDIKPIFQTTPEDYDEPVYHQGHLANSESIDQTQNANDETFYMSNMTPQLPTHNTGIWKGLENRERKWANKRGRVIVLAGPVYHNQFTYIGDHVPVPSAYWKVIYDPSVNEAIAYLIPHKKLKTSQLDDYLVSIDFIEAMYDLDLLDLINDELEADIEKVTQLKQW